VNIKHVIPHKTDKTLTINSAETVKAAIRLLHTKGVGLLIVVDDQAELFGVVSERDVIRALDQKGAEALDMPIADLSTRDVITCPVKLTPMMFWIKCSNTTSVICQLWKAEKSPVWSAAATSLNMSQNI